jgi:hypothetical protein
VPVKAGIGRFRIEHSTWEQKGSTLAAHDSFQFKPALGHSDVVELQRTLVQRTLDIVGDPSHCAIGPGLADVARARKIPPKTGGVHYLNDSQVAAALGDRDTRMGAHYTRHVEQETRIIQVFFDRSNSGS